MHPEPTGQRGHADAMLAACSHSVHFLVHEPCSRSLLWFRRRPNQRVIGLALGLGIPTSALIPRGDKPLNPWSPVPAGLHYVQSRPRCGCARRFWDRPEAFVVRRDDRARLSLVEGAVLLGEEVRAGLVEDDHVVVAVVLPSLRHDDRLGAPLAPRFLLQPLSPSGFDHMSARKRPPRRRRGCLST